MERYVLYSIIFTYHVMSMSDLTVDSDAKGIVANSSINFILTIIVLTLAKAALGILINFKDMFVNYRERKK